MKTAVLKVNKPFSESDLLPAAEILRRGGLVAFPTETVYGLGADALNEKACKEIYKAKGRPSDNPLIVHIAEPEDAEKYAFVPDVYHKLAGAFLPGPLTVIMKKRSVIPAGVTGGLDTVAIRCPSDPIAHALIKLAGIPVAAPSANLSGKPSTTAFEHVFADLDGKVDMIIDGGECEIGLESTIIMINESGMTLLRPGAVTAEQLSLFGDVSVDPAVVMKTDDGKPPLAPGMKYRHYAPKASLTAIETGDAYLASEYINEKAKGGKVAVLCCDEDAPAFKGFAVYSIGKRADGRSQAKRLFAALREADLGDHSHIFAVTPPLEGGIGLALHNRLMKAAGYDVVMLPRTFKIGVTGKSGSGKSTFAKLLSEKLDCSVLDCDAINRDMLENDEEYKKLIASTFGDGVLTDGAPDRKKLGALVFSDGEKLKTLNSIAHPRIVERVVNGVAAVEKAGGGFVIIDAPLLCDTPLADLCDLRITVEASDGERERRLSIRDCGTSYLKERTKAQERDFSASDLIVTNGGTLSDLEEKAEKLALELKKHNF